MSAHAARPIATITPLSETVSTSASRSGSGMMSAVRVGIDTDSAPGIVKAHPHSPVQPCGNLQQWQQQSEDRAIALRKLRRVVGPLTPTNVAQQTGWLPRRAERWLERFEAKGLLVKGPNGREWAA